MYPTDADLRRARATRRSEVLNVIADCLYLAPTALAARERLGTTLVLQSLLRDGEETVPAPPGAVRHWFGGRLIRLGTWLGGTAIAPDLSPRPATA